MRKPVFVALAAAVLIMLPGVAAHAQTYTDTTVYSFGATPTDGISPFGGLIIDAQGNLYGTTWSGGGSSNCSPFKGCGTVFKLDSSGNETILHTFTGITDGAGPFGSLTMDKGGNLYGTTSAGGGPKNAGTVFKLTA